MIDTSNISRYTVSKKFQWYTNARPFQPAYMGTTETESAYFYCPYVPSKFKLSKARNKHG